MEKNVAKTNPQERMVNICREADKLQITQDLAINVANSFTAANVMLALRNNDRPSCRKVFSSACRAKVWFQNGQK